MRHVRNGDVKGVALFRSLSKYSVVEIFGVFPINGHEG